VYASDDKELTYTNFRPGYPIRSGFWSGLVRFGQVMLYVVDLVRFSLVRFGLVWGWAQHLRTGSNSTKNCFLYACDGSHPFKVTRQSNQVE
jgi:hypothetical protein